MPLKRATYRDETGKFKVTLIPADELEENADRGVPVGPPDLGELGLPEEIEVRLNNELYYRGILTAQDALKHRSDIMSALQATLKLDVESVIHQYVGKDYRNVRKEEPVTNPGQPVRTPAQRNRRPRRR